MRVSDQDGEDLELSSDISLKLFKKTSNWGLTWEVHHSDDTIVSLNSYDDVVNEIRKDTAKVTVVCGDYTFTIDPEDFGNLTIESEESVSAIITGAAEKTVSELSDVINARVDAVLAKVKSILAIVKTL